VLHIEDLGFDCPACRMPRDGFAPECVVLEPVEDMYQNAS
jgi:hypothetical protein